MKFCSSVDKKKRKTQNENWPFIKKKIFKKFWVLRLWRPFLFFPYIMNMSCSRARGHTFSSKNLIFWLRRPWDMSKKFCFRLSKFWVLRLWWPFLFFPYIMNMSCSRARVHIFSAKNLIFWLRRPCDMSKKVFFFRFSKF